MIRQDYFAADQSLQDLPGDSILALERVHRAMRQGLVLDVLFHDHELGLWHHYHTVVNWVRERYPETVLWVRPMLVGKVPVL